MDSEEIYSSLPNEKRKSQISNTDGVSWDDYRRAEKLNLPIEKQQLIDTLELEPGDNKKKHIYFCLGHYCKNTLDSSLFNFLMERIETEKDNGCKLSILIGISRMSKTSILNIEPLKKLARTRNRDLRINSIVALQQTIDNDG